MADKKIALVLAGGGLAGIAFELGVLRAINEAWLNRSADQLDIYVGTSAGSYVAAYLASGVPVNRLNKLMKQEGSLLGSGGPSAIFFPNVGEVAEKAIFWPITLLNATGALFRTQDPVKGAAHALEELLPTGLFDTWLIQQHLFRMYKRYGVGNRFADLPHDLHIIATDLDKGSRVIFNKENPVPLEKAVAASCAIPLVYRPVRINGHEYVDGGVRGTASIDLALEAGAELIIVINPLVPFENNPEIPAYMDEVGEPDRHISDRGPIAVWNQVSRASIHSGLLYHIKQVKRANPDVAIMLIEPSFNDPRLSFRNIMSYWKLNEVSEQGFQVGMSFWHRNEAQARGILAEHDIRLATRLQEPIAS
ncbi:MAG: patatin-like phospholipase family protein [Ardenticatenales bacterium]|nr:patatin-like phospholipase family protein [Ardenticatenales bacterium]